MIDDLGISAALPLSTRSGTPAPRDEHAFPLGRPRRLLGTETGQVADRGLDLGGGVGRVTSTQPLIME
jgi:hypothetical protein